MEILGPHEGPKDERQGEPALAFSICGRKSDTKGTKVTEEFAGKE